MANDPNKPAGAPEDFGMMQPYEREMRQLKDRDAQEAEMEFRREQDLLAKNNARIAAERKKLEAERAAGPKKSFQLLVAKKEGKFRVVGMYSDREKLSQHLVEASIAFSDADQVLGVVEFDLGVKLDQSPVPPS